MTLSPAKQALASYWTQHHNAQAQRFGISPIAGGPQEMKIVDRTHWWRRHNLAWRLLGRWPRLACRVARGKSYTLSDSPSRRVEGQSLVHWIRYGRVGASHFLLAADPQWAKVLRSSGR